MGRGKNISRQLNPKEVLFDSNLDRRGQSKQVEFIPYSNNKKDLTRTIEYLKRKLARIENKTDITVRSADFSPLEWLEETLASINPKSPEKEEINLLTTVWEYNLNQYCGEETVRLIGQGLRPFAFPDSDEGRIFVPDKEDTDLPRRVILGGYSYDIPLLETLYERDRNGKATDVSVLSKEQQNQVVNLYNSGNAMLEPAGSYPADLRNFYGKIRFPLKSTEVFPYFMKIKT